jgi:amidohydrolase
MYQDAVQVAASPLFDRLVAIRHDLHAHPELSWREHRTADCICQFLDELGVSYRRGVAGTGVIADLPGPEDGPRIALRADMDALPLQEETGLPFASCHPGVMHACGHDAHTTMLLGAAALLVNDRELRLRCGSFFSRPKRPARELRP